MDTHPFLPFTLRYRAAQHRVIRAYAAGLGQQAAADSFVRCVAELRQLGLQGNALIIAAEHMATGRLRQRVAPHEQQLMATV